MPVQLDAAFNYNDLQGLEAIKSSARKDSPEAIKVVAQQFESMFLSLIMKSMRDATDVLASDLESSYQTDFYRDMHDQQLSLTMSQKGGFGLADVLYEQLSQANNPSRPDLFNINIKGMDESIRPIISRAMQGTALEQLLSTETPENTDAQPFDVDALLQQALSQLNMPKADTPVENAVPVSTLGPLKMLGKEALFNSPEEFIENLMPLAEQAAQKIGVDPKYLVAQAALETGWGKFVIPAGKGGSSFNFFGIKADQHWNGESVNATTHEFIGGKKLTVSEPFRSYNSAEDSFNDYAEFVTSSQRYQHAISVASNGKEYAEQLEQAGYATDPQYAEKIERIASSDLFANV